MLRKQILCEHDLKWNPIMGNIPLYHIAACDHQFQLSDPNISKWMWEECHIAIKTTTSLISVVILWFSTMIRPSSLVQCTLFACRSKWNTLLSFSVLLDDFYREGIINEITVGYKIVAMSATLCLHGDYSTDKCKSWNILSTQSSSASELSI